MDVSAVTWMTYDYEKSIQLKMSEVNSRTLIHHKNATTVLVVTPCDVCMMDDWIKRRYQILVIEKWTYDMFCDVDMCNFVNMKIA